MSLLKLYKDAQQGKQYKVEFGAWNSLRRMQHLLDGKSRMDWIDMLPAERIQELAKAA